MYTLDGPAPGLPGTYCDEKWIKEKVGLFIVKKKGAEKEYLEEENRVDYVAFVC